MYLILFDEIFKQESICGMNARDRFDISVLRKWIISFSNATTHSTEVNLLPHSYNMLLDIEATFLHVEFPAFLSSFLWLKWEVYSIFVPVTVSDSSVLFK